MNKETKHPVYEIKVNDEDSTTYLQFPLSKELYDRAKRELKRESDNLNKTLLKQNVLKRDINQLPFGREERIR